MEIYSSLSEEKTIADAYRDVGRRRLVLSLTLEKTVKVTQESRQDEIQSPEKKTAWEKRIIKNEDLT